jgi:dolichol-phosphate mannosyltransferase
MSTRPQLSIITPTFREAVNMTALVRDIAGALDREIPDWELIVVDDDSRDGIDTLCDKLRREGMPIRLIVRRQVRGLATAVIEGFRNARAPVWVVMDADLSHRGIDILKLYKVICAGADFASGSRYLPGGSTDDAWTVYRFLNSKVASLMALPLVSVSDPMSGFFALRRNLLEQGDRLSPVGYKIGLEILIKCRPQSLKEIPIHFRTRVRGHSKLSLRQQLLYLRHIGSLYRYAWRRRIQTRLFPGR